MEYPFKDLMPLDEVLEREGYYRDWTHLDPEVFYSLTQISEYIKTKGYGVDVRLLIAQLAEHFGLKTTQVVDLGNLLTAKHATLKTQFEQAVSQVNADRNALETQFNQSVAQMQAEKDAVIANATVDSEVILARGGKPTLQARLDETTAQLAEKAKDLDERGVNVLKLGVVGDGVTDDTPAIQSIFDNASVGDKFFFPRLNYLLKDTLKIEKEIEILAGGATFIADHSKLTFLFKSSLGNFGSVNINMQLRVHIYMITRPNESQITETEKTGVEFWNVFWGDIRIDNIKNNYKSVIIYGVPYKEGVYSGTTYSTFKFGVLAARHSNMDIITETGGYVTESDFYNGNFSGGRVADVEVESYHLKAVRNDTGVLNNLRFHGPSFEGSMNIGVELNGGTGVVFYSPRFEMPNSTEIVRFLTCQSCGIVSSFSAHTIFAENKLVDTGQYNFVIGMGAFNGGSFDYRNKTIYTYGGNLLKSRGYDGRFPIVRLDNIKDIKTITASGDVEIDLNEADSFEIMVSGNITSINFLNPPERYGTEKEVIFRQLEAYTIENFTGVNMSGSVYPEPRKNAVDIYKFIRSGWFYPYLHHVKPF